MERTQFTFYASFYDAIQRIRDEKQRAMAYDILCAYALRGLEPDLDALPDAVAIAFINARPNLEASRRKALGGSKRKRGQEDFGKIPGRCAEDEAKIPGRCTEDGGKIPERFRKDTGKEKEKEKEIEIENECYWEGPAGAEGKEAFFERFYLAYPPHRRGRREEARECYFSHISGADQAREAEGILNLWKQSDQWRKQGGQYVPGLKNYFARGAWETEPPLSACPTGASGRLGEAELEAIARVLREET